MNPEIDARLGVDVGQDNREKEASSLELEFKEPSVPRNRFWLLSVGYSPPWWFVKLQPILTTFQSMSRSIPFHDRYFHRCHQPLPDCSGF